VNALLSPLALRREIHQVAPTLAVLLVIAGLAGCGKKGPPLAPLVSVPASIGSLEAHRVGTTVYAGFKIPAANQDGTQPADIARVEIWACTCNPRDIASLYRYGTLVATVPVKRPPEPEKEPPKEQPGAKKQAAAQGPAQKPPQSHRPEEPGFDQGADVTVSELLVPATLARVVTPEEKQASAAGRATKVVAPLGPPPGGALLTRVYVAVGVNRGGHKGAPSPRVAVPLVTPPSPPSGLKLTYTETAATLTWLAPAGARRAVQEGGGPDVLPSKAIFVQAQASAYNVYEAPAASSAAPVAPAGGPIVLKLPAPLNTSPLETTAFEDPRVEFGAERCYVVRTVDTVGGLRVESDPSQKDCVTFVDTFPPAAPRGLAAVAGEGAISLIWDPNTEKDLGGYLVLRGEAPGENLQPLTPKPVHETTYRDTGVRPGVRYLYAVVAVDNAKPPNQSAMSSRVEEVAR
jgi:hypothetical protein